MSLLRRMNQPENDDESGDKVKQTSSDEKSKQETIIEDPSKRTLKERFQQFNTQISQNIPHLKLTQDEHTQIQNLFDAALDGMDGVSQAERDGLLHHWILRQLDYQHPYSILQPIMDDPEITSILITNYDTVFVISGDETSPSDIEFADEQALTHFLIQLLPEYTPKMASFDRVLEDGIAISIMKRYRESSLQTVIIRKPKQVTLTAKDLINNGMFIEEHVPFWQGAAIIGLNTLIVGKSNSGTTTFLNMLADFIPKDNLAVVIDPSNEMNIKQSNHIHLTHESPMTVEEQLDFVNRIKPQYLVINDCPTEVYAKVLRLILNNDISLMMNMRGNGSRMALEKMESIIVGSSGFHTRKEVHEQLANTIDMAIHLKRMFYRVSDSVQIANVAEINYEPNANKMAFVTIFEYEAEKVENGKPIGDLVGKASPSFYFRFEDAGLRSMTMPAIFKSRSRNILRHRRKKSSLE